MQHASRRSGAPATDVVVAIDRAQILAKLLNYYHESPEGLASES